MRPRRRTTRMERWRRWSNGTAQGTRSVQSRELVLLVFPAVVDALFLIRRPLFAFSQRDSEPHHASTSRRRGSDASSSSSASGRRSPPRAYDERPSPLLAPSYPLASTHGAARQVSALPHMLANSHQPPQSATRPSLISRPSAGGSTSLKRGAMSMLPSEQAGRALIAYDVDQVSWFHTAYQYVQGAFLSPGTRCSPVLILLSQSSYVCCRVCPVLGGGRIRRGRGQQELALAAVCGAIGGLISRPSSIFVRLD